MAREWRSGYYTPKHPEKYIGDVNNIVYRSSWELETNKFLDNNPNVIEWASEEIAIPYIKSLTQRKHLYYPDYYVKFQDKYKKIITEIWEVKPENQIRPPKKRGKSKKTQLYEQATYVTNIDKWKAAQNWCKQRGIHFRILSEKEIFK